MEQTIVSALRASVCRIYHAKSIYSLGPSGLCIALRAQAVVSALRASVRRI